MSELSVRTSLRIKDGDDSNAVDSSNPLKALLLQGGMDVISGSAGIGVSPKNRTLLFLCALHEKQVYQALVGNPYL